MRERYGEITKQILIGVGIAGIVLVVAAAPGAILAGKLFAQNRRQFPSKDERQKAARSLQRLKKKRLVNIKEKDGKFIIELTKDGKHVFRQIQIEKLQIPKPAHWDGKWRMVIFDIPEEAFRPARGILRAKLKGWEFYPLQKSVWVCPWPCENEIQTVAELYGISRYVDVVVAEKIANDASLRKHFAL